MDRGGILRKKAKAVESGLRHWAKENKILLTGEKLTFTIRIETHSTQGIVEGPGPDPVENMTLLDFFTLERGRRVGVGSKTIARIRNYVRGPGLVTVGDLIKLNRESPRLSLRSIGNTSINAMERMLNTEFPDIRMGRCPS